jgi:hypothetical protein
MKGDDAVTLSTAAAPAFRFLIKLPTELKSLDVWSESRVTLTFVGTKDSTRDTNNRKMN